jgi:hypothetical protein
MNENLSPGDKTSKIIKELNLLKDSSLKLSFWEEFINKYVIIPDTGENNNNNEKNN